MFTGTENMVKLLIEHGANVKVMAKNNKSALILAISSGFDKAAELLIQKDADINVVERYGQTALMYAATKGKIKSFRYPSTKCTQSLALSRLSPISFLNQCSRQFLFIGFDNIIQMIIEKGANINVTDKNGNSALLLAAANGPENIVKQLIENGADINVINDEKNSALILAINSGKSHCVKCDCDIV